MPQTKQLKESIVFHLTDNYEPFFERHLGELKKSQGDNKMAFCPFHGPENVPSLSVNVSTGHFKCFGCKAQGDVFHFFARLEGYNTNGFEWVNLLKKMATDLGISPDKEISNQNQLTPKVTSITKKQEDLGKEVEIYSYQQGSGEIVFEVVRYEKIEDGRVLKTFRQRRPNGDGTWSWNVKGVEKPLYRLSKVMRSAEVLLVEGEKDVHVAESLKFVATTNAGGSKAPWERQYTETLKGRNVVLIPDNDKSGREHMVKAASALYGVAESLKWLDLPGLPEKGDLSDWVETQPDKEMAAERLAIMVTEAPEWEPTRKITLQNLCLERSEFLRLEVPEKSVLLGPWLTEQSIGLVSAWRGVGKGWFILGVINSLITGEPFGPWTTVNTVPCLYLDGEMPVQDLMERLQTLNPSSRRTKVPFYVISDHWCISKGYKKSNLMSEEWRDEMRELLITKGVKFFVVDNIASLASGLDENSKQDWDPINSWLLDLRFIGVTTFLLHHTSKTGDQRGTSAREDNIDTSIRLIRPPGYTKEDGCKFILSFMKARVRTRYLSQITDLQFQHDEDKHGRAQWTWAGVKGESKKEILRRLNEGNSQAEVSRDLGIDKSYVSRVRKWAIEEGFLTSKNRFTQTGLLHVLGERSSQLTATF